MCVKGTCYRISLFHSNFSTSPPWVRPKICQRMPGKQARPSTGRSVRKENSSGVIFLKTEVKDYNHPWAMQNLTSRRMDESEKSEESELDGGSLLMISREL
ncbi:hypothetical protein XENOCAPTIV_010762 [Xenoophorus captivus]|uniref:Uncharacterized protein n=1 Tax=Xenoophorus captivus TaxID=1517983 RepID=A0ABV0QD21_9TELE